MRNYISFPKVEGDTSRQAHADLPEGTYERELGKEGFFGPATHMYHRHPPTGWTSWEGPLRPRAFDLTRLPSTLASPWLWLRWPQTRQGQHRSAARRAHRVRSRTPPGPHSFAVTTAR